MSSCKLELNNFPAETTKIISSHEVELNVCPETSPPPIAIEVQSNVDFESLSSPTASKAEPEADEDVEQAVKSKSYYQDMPLEVKQMIIEYSCNDWGVKSQTIPACVMGFRGTASDVFYNTCTFDLCGMDRWQLAKIPEHVFEQICHMALSLTTDLNFSLRQRAGQTIPRLRSLHIYQGFSPCWSNTGLYYEAMKDLSYSDRARTFMLTLQRPKYMPETEDGVDYNRAHVVATANGALGVEGVREYMDGEGEDETWVWQAPKGEFLHWPKKYRIFLSRKRG